MENERRNHRRYNQTLSLIVRLEDETHTKAVAQTQNISREGMKLITNTKIAVKSIIHLDIHAADKSETFHAVAKIIWRQKVKESEHDIEYGVQFLKIDPIEKFHLIEKTYEEYLNKE